MIFNINVGDSVRFRRPFHIPGKLWDAIVNKVTPFGVRVDIGNGLGVAYADIVAVNGVPA